MPYIPQETLGSNSLYFQVDIENDATRFALFTILQGSFTQEEITAVDTLKCYVWFWHRNYLEYLYAIFLKSC